MVTFKNKRIKTVLLVLTGVVLLGCGIFTALWQDSQAILYNQGLQSYLFAQTASADNPQNPVKSPQDREKMMENSVKMFDFSIQVYKMESQSGWLERFIFPPADKRLAAKASFREGNTLTWLGKEKEAVAAYELYLQLNPGGINDQIAGDTYNDQHNLELQFNHNPALQQAEGKGKGKDSGNGTGKKQQPGDPGNQAGRQPHTKM